MKRILVIEDDSDLRQMIAEVLEYERYEVLQAHNTAQGIKLGMTYQPDAVLCDWTLPDGSGLNVLQALQNSPVIILSGNLNANIQNMALDNGATGYLAKPFKIKEVINKVRQILNRV
ncbi:MAG: response regulator transcription factor [Anaerolineae bacterium]|nr:response regulator transcription factor [Anaerolineae bacterium]